MQLPRYLLSALEDLIAGQRELSQTSAQLSGRYKCGDYSAPALRSRTDRLAYLTTRLPATFAAALHVFRELRFRAPAAEIESFLDLGAGPGTALLAAAENLPVLKHASLVEADPEWLRLGQQIAGRSPSQVVRQAEWIAHNLRSEIKFPPHDLVAMSYSLGEFSPSAASHLVMSAWQASTQFLVLIEPGTMRGFSNINHARTALIAAGAGILAPCPHQAACPMAQAGDWCHFAQRVERTTEHRRAKGGVLGYEDEKFSYVIASRQPLAPAAARIIRHPQKHSGHVKLQLCTAEGLADKTVTKSNKGAYRRARQADWGDAWQD